MNTEKLHELCARLRPLAKKYRAALIVLLAGVLLLVSGGREETSDAAQTQTGADSFSLSDFETQLCCRLSAIDGAGRVELMLSLEQTGEAVYAVNTRETGGAASSRESDVAVISSSGYGETPVTVKNVLPTFRGAIVLCDGAENAAVRLAVTQAVETVVLLSHKKADSYIHIDVEFGEGEGKIPVDSIAKRAEAYKPKEKVTYKMIKEYIEAKYGFKVHTAYIAEVKRNLGLPMYDAPNAVEELKQPRKHPTPEKVEAIKDALRYFAVI